MLGHHRHSSEKPFNGVSLAGRWWSAYSGIWIPLPSSTTKNRCQSWTPLPKLSGSAHASDNERASQFLCSWFCFVYPFFPLGATGWSVILWLWHCLGILACFWFYTVKQYDQMLYLFDLILYIPVNHFSVMSWRVFLGWTSTKQRIKSLAQEYITVSPTYLTPNQLEPKRSAISKSWILFNKRVLGQNHLCNLGRGYHAKQFCEILNLDQWRSHSKIFLI